MGIFKLTPFLLTVAISYFSLYVFAADSISSITINDITYNIIDHVSRDVVIIGGGSSGTYAAISLLDAHRTIAVIHNQDQMGGHTNTYTDPKTGLTENYGVIVYHNTTIVKEYAARLNVTLTEAGSLTTNARYVDFRTGVENTTYTTANFTTGLALYIQQLKKYPYIETGFDLPNPVPKDLLLSFGEFAIKYNLGDEFLGFLFAFAEGLGDLLSKPTLYVFKNFGMGVISGFTTGFLNTATNDNSLIYQHASAIIGSSNIFLSSTIIAVNRSGKCVQLLIHTPSGHILIDAQKLIFSIPPKLENLSGWDLSISEQNLFSQFNNCGYYVGVFSNTGIPPGLSITNIGSNTLYNFPPLPGAYGINPTPIPQIFNLYYGSATSLSDDEVRASMFAEFEKLRIANITDADSKPELLAYTRHTPFELWVSSEAIKGGFYRDLYGLQGVRNTWYTGAAFHTHDSSLLWEFTRGLIPRILASLS